jgi:hypothetical protein
MKRLVVGVPWWIALPLWLCWITVMILLTFAGLLVLAGAGVLYGIGAALGSRGEGCKSLAAGVYRATTQVVDRMNGHQKAS